MGRCVSVSSYLQQPTRQVSASIEMNQAVVLPLRCHWEGPQLGLARATDHEALAVPAQEGNSCEPASGGPSATFLEFQPYVCSSGKYYTYCMPGIMLVLCF